MNKINRCNNTLSNKRFSIRHFFKAILTKFAADITTENTNNDYRFNVLFPQ